MSLTLEQAVSLALENNLNLKKNQIDINTSSYSEQRVWSEIFPAISASGSIGFASPMFSGDGFALNENSLRYRTEFGITLGLNAGIPYAMRSIRIAHQANILRNEDVRNLLSIQITKRFYSLIAEKNNLLHLEEVLDLAQKQYDRNQISFNNGLIRELTLIQSSLSVENARYSLSMANTSYINNMNEFIAMLGLDSGTVLNLSGEINIIKMDADAESLIKQYLPLRPDIIMANQEIERLENASKQITMQNKAPSLNLSLDWESSDFDPFTDNFRGTARVSIPIDPWIPGTSRNQSVTRAQDSIEKAKLDLIIAEEQARTQIRSLAALLRGSWDSIAIARLSFEVAELTWRLSEQSFGSGTLESLDMERARNDMAASRQRLLQTELTYFNLILDLSSAINMDWNELIKNYGVH